MESKSYGIIIVLLIGILLGPSIHIRAYMDLKEDRNLYGKIYDMGLNDDDYFLSPDHSSFQGIFSTNNADDFVNDTLYFLAYHLVNQSQSTRDYYLISYETSPDLSRVDREQVIDLPITIPDRVNHLEVMGDRYYAIQLKNNISSDYYDWYLLNFDNEHVISNRTVKPSVTSNLNNLQFSRWMDIYDGNLYVCEIYVNETQITNRLVKYDLLTLEIIEWLELDFAIFEIDENGLIWTRRFALPLENINYYRAENQSVYFGYYGYDFNSIMEGKLELKTTIFQHDSSDDLILTETASIKPLLSKINSTYSSITGFVFQPFSERTIRYELTFWKWVAMSSGYIIIGIQGFRVLRIIWRSKN